MLVYFALFKIAQSCLVIYKKHFRRNLLFKNHRYQILHIPNFMIFKSQTFKLSGYFAIYGGEARIFPEVCM